MVNAITHHPEKGPKVPEIHALNGCFDARPPPSQVLSVPLCMTALYYTGEYFIALQLSKSIGAPVH
jgi:hypothetical protein